MARDSYAFKESPGARVAVSKRTVTLVCLLIVIFTCGALLWRGANSGFSNWVSENPFTPSLFLFGLFSALVGFGKIFVDMLVPMHLSVSEVKVWEQIRMRGRLSYILEALMIFGIPIAVGIAIEQIVQDAVDIIRNFTILTLVFLGCIAAIANSIWNTQESVYLKANDTLRW